MLDLAAGRCGAACTAAASLEILRGHASLQRGDVLAARIGDGNINQHLRGRDADRISPDAGHRLAC